jgi:CoA:oxalate CoA-transferase
MQGLLGNITILDLTTVGAGPFMGSILGDLGANVIKVESFAGDEGRRIGPDLQAGGLGLYFIAWNRNKRSIRLDLKNEKGLEVFYSMVKKADVVADNFRTGVCEKLRIDYESLRIINPSVIYAKISAFGTTGPYKERPGYDLIVQAMSGGMSITGEPGGEPVRAGIPLADLAGGCYGVIGILSALNSRSITGKGQKVEISLLDGQIAWLTYQATYYFFNQKIPGPVGAGHPSAVLYDRFRTSDGYVVIIAHKEPFWSNYCKAIGREDLSNDERFDENDKRVRNKRELYDIIEPILITKSTREWEQILVKYDVPCGPVNNLKQALNDPQVLSRNMVVDIDIPGYGSVKVPGNPIKIAEFKERFVPTPKLGEHSQEVLKDFGYSDLDIKELRGAGVI